MTDLNGGAHGGLDYARLELMGIRPEDVLDFSVSVNPFPIPERVIQAAADQGLYTRYPDSGCTHLRRDIAEYHGLSPEEILPVNGTSQGIFLIAAAHAGKPVRTQIEKRVEKHVEIDSEAPPAKRSVGGSCPTCIVSGPTYGEYDDAWKGYGGRMLTLTASEEQTFAPSSSAFIEAIRAHHPRLVWICEPNNPTGRGFGQKEIQRVRRVCRETDTILVLDEAYRNFRADTTADTTTHTSGQKTVISNSRTTETGSPESLSTETGVLRLRSMTKDFGIPGLRLGYIVGTPEDLSPLRRLQPDWSVNAPAQRAGSACLEEVGYFRDTWRRTREAAVDLGEQVAGMGFQVIPFAANFFLMKAGDVSVLTDHLWKRLIQVRDCTSFGLSEYIRIGSKTPEENRRLISALEEFI